MGKELTIPDAAEGKLGPAMARLNERQRAFVVHLLGQRRLNFTEAAIAAGYSTAGSPSSIRVTGSRLGHDEKILEAIREEGQRRMTAGIAVGVGRLLHILENSVDEKNQLKAIEMMFNRVGLHPKTEHHNVNLTVETDGDKLQKALAMCKVLGLDPKEVLGTYMPKSQKSGGNIVDAEYEEVEPAQIEAPEGLEDIW